MSCTLPVGMHRTIALLLLLSPAGLASQKPAGPALGPDRIAEIESLVEAKMSKAGIPGLSIALLVDGKLVWSKGYGLADVENGVPARADSVYRSASIGKTMTATAAMQLAERGQLDLDAPIQRYCRHFPEKQWPLTTRHLLAHLGGIRHYGPNADAELHSTRRYESVAASLEPFRSDPLLFEPGTRHNYSTYGYVLLGCVVEGAAGMPFMTYMRTRVFEPSGMARTRDDDPFAIVPGRAEGYTRGEDGTLRNSRFVDMSNRLPAGGYLTTAEDLARFAKAFMAGELVSAETRAVMLEPQRTRGGEVVAYGLGWGLFPGEDWYGEKEAFHGGMTPQVSGVLYLLPRRQFAVAILTNLEGVSERTELAAQIAKIALNLGERP